MCEVIINIGQKRVYAKAYKGQLLSDLIKQEAVDFAFPCAGNHTCGKCKVTVEGGVSKLTGEEAALLNESERRDGIRLACFCHIMQNAVIKIQNSQTSILSRFEMPDFEKNKSGIGIACDIGTTSVVVKLFDIKNGLVLAEKMAENSQKAYGADVISRILSCKESDGQGLNLLSGLIRRQLEDLISKCMEETEIEGIDAAVVTGNTTMLHIYEHLDPSSIAVSPFITQSLFGGISEQKLKNAQVYIPRCIGAYVGADLVCAILASGMYNKQECTMLVDIGTNGEIALCRNGELICCSTAAGPAFEGAGLSMGMLAADGAIDSVTLENDTVQYTVIGKGQAKGICGSGIIDLLSIMKKNHILDETGYMANDFLIGDSGVIVTKEDIRQIQLAKSAICAGIYTLIHTVGINISDITAIYVAGGFGNFINMESAADIGLLPKELLPKIKPIGNAAFAGASMILLSDRMQIISEDIGKRAKELQLSQSPFFMDKYIECMMFE